MTGDVMEIDVLLSVQPKIWFSLTLFSWLHAYVNALALDMKQHKGAGVRSSSRRGGQ
jgi:hypothetical protein